MSIFKSIKNFFIQDLEVKHSQGVTQDYFSQMIFDSVYGNGVVSDQQAMQYYRENSAVATSVDKIATAVEQIEPVLKIGEDYVTDHELLTLIKNPNGFNDYKEFIGSFIRYYLLTSNTYMISLGNYKYPSLELYSINPTNISIIPHQDNYPDYYNVNNTVANGNYVRTQGNRGEITRFTTESGMAEIYHLMGFTSMGNNLRGDSILNSIMGEIKAAIKGNEHNISILDNSINPSMWINYNDNPDLPELNARMKNFVDQKAGAKRAGMPIFSSSDGKDGGPTISNFGQTNKDMDYAQLNEFANYTIYNRYGIPLPLVTLKASTYNNIENAIVDFYENTVTPNIDTMFSGMSKFLIPKYKDLANSNAILTFNPETISSLMAKSIKELSERSKIGIETINELRTLLPDREPLEDGDILAGATVTREEDSIEEEPEPIEEDTQDDDK